MPDPIMPGYEKTDYKSSPQDEELARSIKRLIDLKADFRVKLLEDYKRHFITKTQWWRETQELTQEIGDLSAQWSEVLHGKSSGR